MATPVNGDLFPELRNPPDTRVINERCLLRAQDGHRVVIVSGIVLAHYALGDRMAEAHAMVSLVEQGWADQNEVAHAFDCSARTVRRDQHRYEDGGLAALGQPRGYPEGRARLTASRRRTVQQLKAHGHSHCAIARRLGVTETAIRKLLRRMGWKESVCEPNLLALEGGPTVSSSCSSPQRCSVSPAQAVNTPRTGRGRISKRWATRYKRRPNNLGTADARDKSRRESRGL